MVTLGEALDGADSATTCLPTSDATPHFIPTSLNNATGRKQAGNKKRASLHLPLISAEFSSCHVHISSAMRSLWLMKDSMR